MSANRSTACREPGDVVGHEQALCSDNNDVVDNHANQILTDGVVLVDCLRDCNLGADTIGRSCEQRFVVILNERDVHHSGESAEATEH